MKRYVKMLVAPALGALSLGAFAAPITVDLFAPGTEQSVTDATDGGVTQYATEVGNFASILGGYRDIGVNCLSSTLPGGSCGPNQEASASVGSGAFLFSTDANIIGSALIAWDGMGTAGAAAGLGGFDLTDGGTLTNFLVETFFSDSGSAAGWSFNIVAEDGTGNITTIDLVASDVNGPPAVESLIPFFRFTDCGSAGVDFSVTCNVGAGTDLTDLERLQVNLNTDVFFGSRATAIDLTLLGVTTVPVPGPLALFGIGMLGLSFSKRMFKKIA